MRTGLQGGLVLCFALVACSSHEPHELKESVKSEQVLDCESANEFITAMTYLRNAKEMQVSEAASRKIAMDVSSGCTGSAGRFIDVTELLKKSGLDSASAIDIAREAAPKGDDSVHAFTSIFRQAFLPRYLDLNLGDAIRLSRSLSVDFKGNPVTAQDDFEAMVDFCVGKRKLDLPKPSCAQLAARVAKYTENTGDESVAEPFIDAYDFLTDKDGPALVTGDALRVAEALVAVSPFAVENFQQAYKYAAAKSGLKLDRSDAVRLAQDIAKHSVAETTVENR